MNIFLKTFSVKKYFIRLKKIFATSPPRVAGVGCRVVVCSGGVRITLHSAPRLGHGDFSQLQPRQPAHGGTLTQPATVGMWWVKGLLIDVPQKRKITLKFMYYVKVFHGWCFVSNAILFWINEIDNNFVTRYDFKHFDAVYASKVPFLKIVQKCITQKI